MTQCIIIHIFILQVLCRYIQFNTLPSAGLGMIPIRLSGSELSRQGRVEILYNSTWRSVCNTDWDMTEANVVCRQLGYGEAKDVPPGSKFQTAAEEDGGRVGEMWLDNVQCRGHEAVLAACSHSRWGKTNCGVEQEAGVLCGN